MKKFIAVMTSIALGVSFAISGVSPASASVSTNMVKIQPLPMKYKVSSGYSNRINPVTKKRELHRGLDYPAPCGTPILAVMDGKIVHNAYETGGFGWYIQVQSGKTSAMYGHMIKKSGLRIGTKVYRGQTIGYVGSTGMSTGCHTHFELRDHTKKGYASYGYPFNPTSKMKKLKNLSSPRVVNHSSIKNYYKKHKSSMGYPRNNYRKLKNPNGIYQTFSKGTAYWTSKHGTHFVKGGIKTAYKKVRYEKGDLKFPTSDEKIFKYNKKARYQNFEKGMIIWSSKTGAHVLKGAMKNKWKSAGWERSALKLPKNSERCGLKDRGCYQTFEKASMHWTKKTGAQITKGGIRKAWKKTKYENGKLGYPTSGEFKWHKKTRQNFQGGYITWTSKKGTKVYYK